MAVWDQGMIERPSREVVEMLEKGLLAEQYQYLHDGEPRDYDHERRQDDAMRFVLRLQGRM